MNPRVPATISVQQAGELLGVSRRTAYRAADRGQIPVIRIGRRWFVPTARLLDLLGLTPDEVDFGGENGAEPDVAMNAL